MSEIIQRILTRFCRKIVGWASNGLRLHRRRLKTTSASVLSFNQKEGFLTCHSLLQQERLKLLAIRSEALLYTRRITTIPPYDSSETITESVRVVAGRLRFSRRSPETTRRHWISTWICNPTQNLATSLRLFGGRLRLIGGHRRSSEIVSGMPKMGEKSCEQSYNFKFKDGDRDGCGDDKKTIATIRRRPESASDGCKLVRSVSIFFTPVLHIADASQMIYDWHNKMLNNVGDKFWPRVVVENKESLNTRSNNPNKSGAVTLSEIF